MELDRSGVEEFSLETPSSRMLKGSKKMFIKNEDEVNEHQYLNKSQNFNFERIEIFGQRIQNLIKILGYRKCFKKMKILSSKYIFMKIMLNKIEKCYNTLK